MKISVEINNLAEAPVKDAFFRAVAEKTLQKSGYAFFKNNHISISLAIVGKAEMRKLNKKYRKKDEPTDVLSFAEFNNFREIREFGDKEIFLGELILCYNDIKEYAEKNGLDTKKELARAVAHGILHLLGMKHGKKMFKAQNKIISGF